MKGPLTVFAMVVVMASSGCGAAKLGTARAGSTTDPTVLGQVDVIVALPTTIEPSTQVAIDLIDFGFRPSFVKLPKGTGRVRLIFRNTGRAQHRVLVVGYGVDAVLAPGAEVDVDVDPSHGDVTFFDPYYRQQGMQGGISW
jgi:hypothetical protein